MLWTRADGELSRWVHWLLTTRAALYVATAIATATGKVIQGREGSQDGHLRAVVRYAVEAGPTD